VAAAGGSEAAQIAAVLHDVVEDGDVTLDELANSGFSPDVVSAVDALTRRAAESYADFVLRAGSNSIGRLVKLADLADNLDPFRIETPTPRDLEREHRYRSAWSHLTGNSFPLGAPFPVRAATERTSADEALVTAERTSVELESTHWGLNERTVTTAWIGPDGSLEVEYYASGDEVERQTGDSDYEHYTTVSPSHVADVRQAILEDLGIEIPSGRVLPDSASVLSLLSDFYRGHATPSPDFDAWLREKGIPYETFTY
jgi:hypothetical protein